MHLHEESMICISLFFLKITDIMAPSEIIQVTNIAPMATREHIRTLFGYLGRIEELVMYPPSETQDCPSKVIFAEEFSFFQS